MSDLLTLACFPRESDGNAVVLFREARLGKLQLQFAQHIHCSQDRIRVLPDSLRHLQQNAMNLRLLFLQQSHQLVVLLNSFERLNKHGLPAGTGAVHHALHAALLLNFYRNDEALAAYRNQFVLNRSALGQAA
jgi:hypothetical protein